MVKFSALWILILSILCGSSGYVRACCQVIDFGKIPPLSTAWKSVPPTNRWFVQFPREHHTQQPVLQTPLGKVNDPACTLVVTRLEIFRAWTEGAGVEVTIGASRVAGGDLHYHLSQHGVFTEQEMRFYAAEVILGLEHMHRRYVVYRDLKVVSFLSLSFHCAIRCPMTGFVSWPSVLCICPGVSRCAY